MRLASSAVAAFTLLFFAAGVAHSAFLLLEADARNQCVKSGGGGMWLLRDTRVNALPVHLGTVKVTLERSDDTGFPSREVIRSLTFGESQELGCSQGKPRVTFQIVKEE